MLKNTEGKLEWLNSISLAELQRKIGEIYFVDHYKMIADQFLYKKDFETSLFLRIAIETGIRSADIPMYRIVRTRMEKLLFWKKPKEEICTKNLMERFLRFRRQSLRIMKLLHRKQGKYLQNQKSTMFAKFLVLGEFPGFISIAFGIIGER